MLRSQALVLGLSVLLASGGAAQADTAVGNGGDVLTQYLETIRFSLQQTLWKIRGAPGELSGLCSEARLSLEQRHECQEFIREAAPQFLALNRLEAPIPFVIRFEPLEVIGPDGLKREVDARTALGPEGPIEFHYQKIEKHSPAQLLALLAHELGHKVSFRGANVQDNVPTPAFPLGGRHLLDAVGATLAAHARQSGFIGAFFGLFDQFKCTASIEGRPSMRTLIQTRRLGLDPVGFNSFSTGIWPRPGDPYVSIPESADVSLALRVIVEERGGCDLRRSEGRFTRVQIVRVREATRENPAREETVVAERTEEGWSPVCDPEPRPVEISYGTLMFSCGYIGAVSYTDSTLPD